ncbi:MAG TPA: aromatic-ring-hydroxylating dioxygenase subunit beta [Acidimicrobiales bacterium]|nr:aromatic-ring-hydroxylating dioxygenase subunit beta [Acidimicrobiales bacterium]
MTTDLGPADTGARVRIGAADPRFDAVTDFYATEAELLDDRLLARWLEECLADDVVYQVPVRTTRGADAPVEFLGHMYHLDENRASLGARVAREGTGLAWAEDPPSRARRHLSALRVYEGPEPGELLARMNVLLTRNRLDRPTYELLSYERRDRLVDPGDGLRLAERVALVDQSCLGMVNLAIFL